MCDYDFCLFTKEKHFKVYIFPDWQLADILAKKEINKTRQENKHTRTRMHITK
jgi:hypothetical protein